MINLQKCIACDSYYRINDTGSKNRSMTTFVCSKFKHYVAFDVGLDKNNLTNANFSHLMFQTFRFENINISISYEDKFIRYLYMGGNRNGWQNSKQYTLPFFEFEISTKEDVLRLNKKILKLIAFT